MSLSSNHLFQIIANEGANVVEINPATTPLWMTNFLSKGFTEPLWVTVNGRRDEAINPWQVQDTQAVLFTIARKNRNTIFCIEQSQGDNIASKCLALFIDEEKLEIVEADPEKWAPSIYEAIRNRN